MIIINADDWGRTQADTNATLESFKKGKISSASAMVFMADSVRGAKMALDAGIDVGLHLNYDLPFTGKVVSDDLRKAHNRTVSFLRRSNYALILYNPFLRWEFKYLFQAQWDEFVRIYGKEPSHIDGHHHMHLGTNILLDLVIPRGLKVRGTFFFFPGEKDIFNRMYRSIIMWWLGRNYTTTDFLFAISKIVSGDRLKKIAELSRNATIEIMVHPAVLTDNSRLMSEEFAAFLENVTIGIYADLKEKP